MARVLFIVKATIAKEKEEAFNRWYNEEHAPQAMQFKGMLSARRFRAIMGEEKYQYIALFLGEAQLGRGLWASVP